MFYYKCINKIRNKNNVIESYELMDLEGNRKIVDKDLLKEKIRDGSVTITNLLLTKDNKLIARSVSDEAALMKKLGVDSLSSNDEKLILKAKMIGAAPEVDDKGKLVDTSNNSSNVIHITPDVRSINSIYERDKNIVIHGNNKLEILNYVYCKELQIKNPTVLDALLGHKFKAETIIISVDNMDEKIIDLIFKAIKTSIEDFAREYNRCTILIDNSKLDKEIALKRMKAVLKRQKPSSNYGRRAYDLSVYIHLMVCLAISYRDSAFLDGLNNYIKKFETLMNLLKQPPCKGENYRYGLYAQERMEELGKLINEAVRITKGQ